MKEGPPARYLMEPMVLAKLLQAAEIGPDALVLDVGAATGYSTAVLARLAGQVVALEEDAELAAQGSNLLVELGLLNAAFVQGPLTAGWPGESPYDVILLNGAVESRTRSAARPAEAGRAAASPWSAGAGRGGPPLFTNTSGGIGSRVVFDAAVPVLPGFEARPGFVF